MLPSVLFPFSKCIHFFNSERNEVCALSADFIIEVRLERSQKNRLIFEVRMELADNVNTTFIQERPDFAAYLLVIYNRALQVFDNIFLEFVLLTILQLFLRGDLASDGFIPGCVLLYVGSLQHCDHFPCLN